MGKQDKAASPVVKLSKGTGPSRKRRNSFQRKSLSKAMKRMFASNISSVRAMLVTFEKEGKSRSMA